MVTIGLNKDEETGLEFCENFKYKLRKLEGDNTIMKESMDRTFVEKEPVSKKGSKRGKKKELNEEEK